MLPSLGIAQLLPPGPDVYMKRAKLLDEQRLIEFRSHDGHRDDDDDDTDENGRRRRPIRRRLPS